MENSVKNPGPIIRIFAAGILACFMMILFHGCAGNTPTAPSDPNGVSIAGMAFTPASLTVAVGTTVTWTNNDGITHTVTSNTSVFNSGNLAAGGKFTFTFAAAGTYPYKCTIHPSMTGTIIVH